MDLFAEWMDEELAPAARLHEGIGLEPDPLNTTISSWDSVGHTILEDVSTVSSAWENASMNLSTTWNLSLASTEATFEDPESCLVPRIPFEDSRSNLDISQATVNKYQCGICHEAFPSKRERLEHQKSHGYRCNQCNKDCNFHFDLNRHAEKTGHNAYKCTDCEATFSRLDVLGRHRLQHTTEAIQKFSCTHCKKWRAPNGFARKDHLTQHLRNYHHIEVDNIISQFYAQFPSDPGFHKFCLHEGCPMYRTKEEGAKMYYSTDFTDFTDLFPTRSAFTKHMRNEHDESTYPCTKPGCKKVGGKGFFRKRDFMKHMKREHDIDIYKEEESVASESESATNLVGFGAPGFGWTRSDLEEVDPNFFGF